jgi:phosphoglycerol transferase MdoB-like AlkP superfamily enzyme
VKKYKAYFAYFIFWLFYFVLTKAVFLAYHHNLTAGLTLGEVFRVFLFGLRMDASFSAYICIFPFLLLCIRAIFTRTGVDKIILIYTNCLVIILSFLTAADLELYRNWGYRIDITPLQYLKSPREMATSMSASPVLLLVLIFALLSVFFVWLYRKSFHKLVSAIGPPFNAIYKAIAVFLVAVLFVPIRGGVQKIPMIQSDVYFSQKLFADHAALNLPWNLMSSVINRNSNQNPFLYLSTDSAKHLVNDLYNTGPARIPAIISIKKPNVVFIILESFTAKLVGCLGGTPGVTPHLDSIASEGLLFTNIYAAGDRSEKGQVAVLSGYPNQAITSIIKTPTKTVGLPQVTKALKQYGYHSSYTYGGELEFANIKSYLVTAGFDDLVSKYSFSPSERTTSWGVHDHIVFNRFFDDLEKQPQPFFATLFTISSHEPYDVPMAPRFPGKDETTLFKNAAAYTDSTLGVFIDRLKKDSLWSNTLIVLVADHGHPLPGQDANDRPSKFHIPLIFTGGALKLHGIISTIGSQTDIATTVLDQLGISTASFKWGKDLLDSSARQFAFYNFNDGFGFVTPSGIVTIDNISKKVIYQSGNPGADALNAGKAYMQLSYQDFLER